MRQNKLNSAFTLMELIVVVIIVSIIAAFAIPSYNTSVLRAHEKDIVANLRAIAAAEAMYSAENQTWWPTTIGAKSLGQINSNLRLGIIANRVSYTCRLLGDTFCTAVYLDPPTWTVRLEASTNWKPYCSVGTCPTCKNLAGGGCPN